MGMGEFYCGATLVRVVGPGFTAGLLLDPVTDCVVFAAPILRHLTGQPRAKLRQTFQRLGWKATIVPRGAARAAGRPRARQSSLPR
jgi:hypothetical protein